MGAFIGAAVIMVMASAIAYFCKKRIEDTFFISFASVSFILYVFGIFGVLKAGVVFTGFVALLCLLAVALHVRTDKENFSRKINALREYVLTPGLLVFVFFTVFFVILNYGRAYYLNDEFSHWGLTIKNMFALDELYCVPDSSDTFKDYPPFATLICYFHTAITGSYNESYTFTGMGLLMASCFMPVFKIFDFKKRKSLVCVPATVVLCFAFTIVFKLSAFTILAVDTLIALISAYVFLLHFGGKYESDKKFDFVKVVFISVALSALTLTKSIAIGFAIFIILVIAADVIFFEKGRGVIGKVLYVFVPAVATGLANISWSFVLKISDYVPDGAGAGQTLEKVCEMVFDTDNLSPYRKQTVDAFTSAAFEGRFPLGTSLFVISIIFILLGALLVFFVRKSRMNIVKYSVLCLLPVAGLILYMTAILYTYAYRFSEYEATTLASYERYTGTFLTMWLLYLAVLFFTGFYGVFEQKFFSENSPENFFAGKVFAAMSVLVLILLVVFYMFLYPYSAEFSMEQRLPSNHASVIGEMYAEMKAQNPDVRPADVKICYVADLSENREYLIANYNAAPFTLSFDSAWPVNIEKYDYIYFESMSKEDLSSLESLGVNTEDPDSWCKKLCSISNNNDRLVIEPVTG